MSLSPGTRVGSCEVIGPLGSGGMGDVYRGRDTKLNRDVAIKTLPDVFAMDPHRVARFEREAQVLAALNHPHIAQVYGVAETPPALIMELVPGESLARRVQQGAAPLREALAIARQIALALEAAHDKGIVHRDLKPANVMLTPDGEVKVLDFGLARIAEPDVTSNPSQSPTLTFAATQMGVILGTAAYMSPEQAKGRVADKRSDVWSFACVLYELLTGRRAFEGEDISDTLAAVLRGEPDWTQLPAGTPPRLAQLLRRCLEKDRAQRIPDISVARYEIEHALAGSAGSGESLPAAATAGTGSRQVRTTLIATACVAFGVAAATAVYTLAPKPPAAPASIVRFEIRTPAGGTIVNRMTAQGLELAVSRDGARIAYAFTPANGPRVLALRRLEDADSTLLPGTEEAQSPAFSPDGRSVAFFADSKLKVLTLGAGQPTVVCDSVGASGIDWIDNDTIVFALRNELHRVPRASGVPTLLAKPTVAKGAAAYRYPEVTPDGQVLLFTSEIEARRNIVARSLATGEEKLVIENAAFPKYLASGHLVFLTSGRLAVAPFDARSMTVTGSHVPMDEGIVERVAGTANFDVSPGGTFVSITGGLLPYSSRFAWMNRQGAVLGRVGQEDLPYPRYPRISPDGTRLVATIGQGAQGQLWAFDLVGAAQPVKLTANDHNVWPVWLPDGKSIIFTRLATSTSAAGRRQEILKLAADGSNPNPERILDIIIQGATIGTVSPDGRWFMFSQIRASSGPDLVMKAVGDSSEPKPWLAESAAETAPAFSSDGKWVAYTSTSSGTLEVYVRPFPGPGAPYRVSSSTGSEPVWSRDGKELYFQSQGRLMAARVVAREPAIAFAPAVMLFEKNFVPTDSGTPRTYDVAPDGRFLMIEHKPNAAPSVVNVTMGWGELVRQKTK